MDNHIQLPSVRRIPVGEVKIWLTGLGVSIGLLMIAGFLTIIGYYGLNAFWPHPVYAFSIANPQENTPPTVYYAAIAKEIVAQEGNAGSRDEYQLFTGNREVYGQAFRYVDKDNVLSMTPDKDLILLERMQGGKAVVKPKHLTVEGTMVLYGTPEFDQAWKQELDQARSIRERMSDMTGNRLGAINNHIEETDRHLKALDMSYEFTDQGAIPRKNPVVTERDPSARRRECLERLKQLQAQYAACIRDLESLASTRRNVTLHYTLGDKSEHAIPIHDVSGALWPNQLGWFGKTGAFLGSLWSFLSEDPREANTEGGIFPAIFGTFVMTVLMSLLVTPIGVIAAIYLKEYAKQGPVVRTVRICVNNLAGVPSIVFGVFGLGFFVYFVGGGIDQFFFQEKLAVSNAPTFGTSGVLWASLTLALMTLPVVIVATEESLSTVSRGLREAALACGASKWQMVQRIILPRAMPGILTGIILAMARGAGEVAPLMLTGVVKLAPDLPIDFDAPFIHLNRKFMHLGFHIFDVAFQSPDSDAARSMVFATSLLLIVLVVVMNLVAIQIRNNLRNKHRHASF